MRATTFWSGFPVDTIAPSTLPDSIQITLTKKFQQIIGALNWLSNLMWPDISAIVSLLAAHLHKLSDAHFDLVQFNICS